ncbi:MAG: ankyrin repeat domain-containing protein [Legionella sp.]|nr:ankyrin repeat domain-containing protein [Legionella sp.]
MEQKSDKSIVGNSHNKLTLIDLPEEILYFITEYSSPTDYALKSTTKSINKLMQNSLRKTEEYFAQKFPHEFTKIKDQLPALSVDSKQSLIFQKNLERTDFYDYLSVKENIKTKQKNKESLDEQEKIYLKKNKNIDVPLLFKYIKSGDIQSIIEKKIDFQELNYLYVTLDSHNLSLFDWIVKMNKQEVLDHFISSLVNWCFHLRTQNVELELVTPPEYQNHTNNTLLHWYIILQQSPKKHLQNTKKEELLKKNINNETPIHLAARNRKLDWLVELYKILGIESLKEIDTRGYTPLHTAASVGNMDAVKFLLENNALSLLNDIQIEKFISVLGTQLNMRHKSNTCLTPWHLLTEYLPAGKMDYFINKLVIDKEHEINELKEQIKTIQSEITEHKVNSEKRKNDLEDKLLLKQNEEKRLINKISQLNNQIVTNDTIIFKASEVATDSQLSNVKEESEITEQLNSVQRRIKKIVTQLKTNDDYFNTTLQKKQKELNVLLDCKLSPIETEFHILQSHIKDINRLNPQGTTALHIATKLGDPTKIEILLKNSADPYLADAEGLTPFHLAAKLKDPEILNIFIRFGANVNSFCKKGMTPFLYAVQEGNIPGMKLFISQKIPSDVTNKKGETALHIAIKNNHIEAVNFLLELELDIDKPTKEGMTPLMYAVINNNMDAVNLLISKGAKGDSNLFILAAKSGFSEMDELLKLKNMDINTVDDEGNSPLHWAVVNQHADIVKFLLKNGCSWDGVNKKGYTPAKSVNSKDKFLLSVFTLKEYIEKLNKECTSKTAGKSGFFKSHRNPNDKLEAALALEKVIIYGEELSTLNKYINILTKGTLKKILLKTNIEIEKIEQAEMKI